MTQIKRTELELYHEFDRARCRHYLNGQLSVMHCHHYTTLYTRLAMDAEFIDGKSLLAGSAEDSFYVAFRDYFAARPGLKRANQLALGCQYYAAVGLGQMEVIYAGMDSGEVVLHHSHVDEGWITLARAGAVYGVAFDAAGDVDEAATLAFRKRLASNAASARASIARRTRAFPAMTRLGP